MINEGVDFVVLWVDSNDRTWQKEFSLHKYGKEGVDIAARFRDWDNFQFWFRMVEKNAPWVRKIHLITCGHYPSWLNKNNPKLNLVKHQDYLLETNLPTFNSNAIELSIHKLEGLAEKFILFNDDMFILNKTQESDFFHDGLPCDSFVLNAHSGEGIANIIMNNLEVLNRHFDKKRVMWQQLSKWLTMKNGRDLLRTLLLLPWPRFTGFAGYHSPQPFLKSTFNELWELEGSLLSETSTHKFRSASDLSQYLFRYWQLVSGKFYPVNLSKLGCVYHLSDQNIDDALEQLMKSDVKTVCLNDTDMISDFETTKRKVNGVLEMLFPNKSLFEI